jgi:hypothetical protein
MRNTRHLYTIFIFYFSLFLLIGFEGCTPTTKVQAGWPTITREAKPWTRWWWHGNAQTKEGITAEMEAYQKAGLGGLEITPIYGVRGYEEKFVDYLSPQWMELFMHTLKEAERLDLGIDMATGTGWPFGGPWVSDEDACKNLNYKTYEVGGGSTLSEKIEFIQPPYLRAVGNQIYEVHQSFSAEKTIALGTTKEPLMRLDPKKIDIKDLVQPISKNKNLQALAIDQVVFERPLALQTLIGYGDNGAVINLTDKVDRAGKLNWIAPEGNWKLYAVFEGWHGKMVERAGPGGEGNVIDHFAKQALQHYLNRFDSAFAGKDIQSLRAFFNDSYEVDDARGASDWTRSLFDDFKTRRGYDLRDHLPALFGNDAEEKNKRILCDYRETISEMVLDNFTQPWKTWAYGKSAIVRNQAHGAPSNILDLYATVDIPEIEGVEPLRIKMASSAGNVTGKRLVSSESATWLNEHFESNLSDIKVALDRFMVNGVNHLFYHGTSYSPPNEPWPGWLFYAAVHLNPRNPLWNDFDALNGYAARCQSFLQNSTPDNDVLLYYPIYDRFSTFGPEMVEHFDGIGKQFDGTAFKRAAEIMLEKGYAFDYISDKQIGNIVWENDQLKTEGNSSYKTILLPKSQYIPLKTFQTIVSLAEKGATIIALDGLPTAVSGYGNFSENEKAFDEVINRLAGENLSEQDIKEIKMGKGKVMIGSNLEVLLNQASIRRESVIAQGIQFIRKRGSDGRSIYFLVNNKKEKFEGWLPLQTEAESAVLYNPMNGEFGKGKFKKGDNEVSEVYVQLAPEQSLIIEMHVQEVATAPFNYYAATGVTVPLTGEWKINFTAGGPKLPAVVRNDSLASWTTFGAPDYTAFSGTATYTLSFHKPSQIAERWLLDLGKVKESADVYLNGKNLGTLIGPVYQLQIDNTLLQENNVLEITVSNLMANRIADLDRRNIFWRKFYNVNFPARKNENRKDGLFDASHWLPKESGLMGPVSLHAIAQKSDL